MSEKGSRSTGHTPVCSGNVYSSVVPGQVYPEEQLTPLLSCPIGLRVNHIVSTGHVTAEDEWYDQQDNEWVLLINGTATLQFVDGMTHDMVAGSYLYIPRHCRHRVLRTSVSPAAVWVAIHHDGDPGQVYQLESVQSKRDGCA
eukprot:CAMPEP_0182428084 /NCGR_PEP_ID=MMETSP1167-20130531/21008_1 /TAXON_ID=2988 /ORGANISM="Mallomonas Sp, Strain CCMP3275" /LENGTH=142 /DNA_ID=CAMNT_0024610745 /DNA_START=288 /DNA_END=713 /DNA_ORIENTATION=+